MAKKHSRATTASQLAEKRILSYKHRKTGGNSVVTGQRELEVLNLNGIGLTSLPEILREIGPVGHLDLAANGLTHLPDWIGEIAVEWLDISGNRLKALPEGLGSSCAKAVVAEYNQLRTLPESLRGMVNLEGLFLSNNPELGIPESILRGGRPNEILSYYFESRGEKGRPLQELKLLLVGRGKAGKTTLVKRLSYEPTDEREPETHSITIRELTLGCPSGPVRTRAWDFGGQEILHSTHQFFLTERSLYLLVLEPRTGLAQRDAEYWLKLIETQGGGSPVIVVMNWSHGRRWRVDSVKLRRKFPFIVDFISTDALHGEGIDALESTILQTVERMPDVWLPFPVRWRAIKDRVAGMKENFLTYVHYTSICAEYAESDPLRQADLAGILHGLGLALYFGNDPRLHDTRVLNPGWVTGGVYAVIRSPSVTENDGQLAVSDMPRVLREAERQNVVRAADYPLETHAFILELMRAFQLAFAHEPEGETGEQPRPVRYLVPELLPEFEPEMLEAWDEAPIRLRYTYDVVLPPGLLPRFIVRTHALSEGAPHWRHGVVLRHGEASALIRAESDRPELYVFVLGGDEDTRRVLVTMVRRELEALHREMKMAPVEELELTGEGDRWISVRSLREMEERAEPTKRMPVRPEGTAEVNVPLELDKLEPAESRAIDRDPASAPVPVRVFVSYAHEDERALQRLDWTLGVLEQHHEIVAWRDQRLVAGEEWDEEIRRRLEEMDIFMFIASQRSLVSPYIRERELKRAQERRDAGEVEIVAVRLEPCAVDEDPYLGKLQRLARKYGSIAQTSPRSLAWDQVRRDVLPVIERVREKKMKAAGLARA